MSPQYPFQVKVTLLTGGWDRPYVFGLTTALAKEGIAIDLIAGEDLAASDFPHASSLRLLRFKKDQKHGESLVGKVSRVLSYYRRLVAYAWTARPKIFHIIWNNGYDTFDRVVLTLYYRLLGKRVILTAHNVNAGRRDAKDSLFNRLTLRFQYALSEHIFVHTERMKQELIGGFGVRPEAISVIPFGINNSVPDTSLTSAEARSRLGIAPGEKAILFFGNIAPYKGLEYLIPAFKQVAAKGSDYRLIVAGRWKSGKSDAYGKQIQSAIGTDPEAYGMLLKFEYIPDTETEIYFKAADVLVLPYTEIFQSGVLFLGYSFGLPALVADVGSLRDDVVEGETGFSFAPRDVDGLTRAIEKYFASELFRTLEARRPAIIARAKATNSWDVVADTTRKVYLESVPVVVPASRSLT